MKIPLNWHSVSEEDLIFDENQPDIYNREFPAKKKVLIDDGHPQEGRFPPNFERYMQYWPGNIVHPVSIVILNNVWEENSYKDWETGIVETDWERGPVTVLTMPNGATMTITELDPWGDASAEVTLEGDWSEYTSEDSEDIGFIEDVVVEAYALSDATAEDLQEMDEAHRKYQEQFGAEMG